MELPVLADKGYSQVLSRGALAALFAADSTQQDVVAEARCVMFLAPLRASG